MNTYSVLLSTETEKIIVQHVIVAEAIDQDGAKLIGNLLVFPEQIHRVNSPRQQRRVLIDRTANHTSQALTHYSDTFYGEEARGPADDLNDRITVAIR